ncbi:MucB/RseB C-terminal domain-containing protein [Acidovorax sp. NCPPB 4044]|uniref:MucB/RseB C-terminal domain-containing protein n=1 Tax=Acidovorax sp. NCPPB 4044 TaxID=2940490 RepID=UPI002303B7A4|nr:MucB/RseB C-terminal domain-containing protein [Acidovorax sp. NCPPB 4044]MDA8519697.1 MucB/RseB C-terminal domain-containing protein [Acidovorax sp. NCPPB 4044]
MTGKRNADGWVNLSTLPRVLGRLAAAALLAGLLSSPAVWAGPPGSEPPASGVERSEVPAGNEISNWIQSIHRASREHSYSGTFVVSSASGAMASSRIWHATDGTVQIERIEALDGTPRTVYRRDDLVRTFLPHAQIVKEERREMPGLFPHLPQAESDAVLRHYRAQFMGRDRVAGQEAVIVWLKPKDALRFGYRIWTARASGLVVKLQTLGMQGQVLEQAAFSQIDFDAPPTVAQLMAQMDDTRGFRLLTVPLAKTTVREAGWQMRQAAAGFLPGDCYKRKVAPVPDTARMPPLQCIFSDGLATVSVFFEPYDAARHAQQTKRMDMGATQALALRTAHGDTWLTAVGEVPQETLRLLVDQIEPVR